MKLETLPTKPKSIPESVYYRNLADLENLISSKPEMFWCYTHLQDLPLSEQSSDPRYCRRCHVILTGEYREMVSARGKRTLWWAPAMGKTSKLPPQVREQGALIMSTLNDKITGVDKINQAPRDGRGRKLRSLPIERIEQLAFDGLGTKAITTRLKSEGISVSYKTVARRLKKKIRA